MGRSSRAVLVLMLATACGGDAQPAPRPVATPDVELSVVRALYRATDEVQSPSWKVRATLRNQGSTTWALGETLLLVETIGGEGRARADSLGMDDLAFHVRRLRAPAPDDGPALADRYATLFGYTVETDGTSIVPFGALSDLTGGRGTVSLFLASLASPRLPVMDGGGFGRVGAAATGSFDAEVISPLGPKERGGLAVVLPPLVPADGTDRAPRHVWLEYPPGGGAAGDTLRGGVRHEARRGAAALAEDVRDARLPGWRRRFTLNWLVDDHPGEAGAVVVETLRQRRPVSLWRAAVVNAGLLREARAVPELLPLLASDVDRGTEILVVEALGAIGDARALPAVRERVGDRDDDVARAAVRALGGFRDTAAVPPLLAYFRRAGDYPDASAAARSIVRIGGEDAVGELVATLANPRGNERRRAAVADALSSEDARRHGDVLAGVLAAPRTPPFVASNVARALGRAGDDRGFAALRTAARSGNVMLAGTAMGVLAGSDQKAWRDTVMAMATGPAGPIRARALYYLGITQVRDALPALRDAAASAEREERENACHALARMGEPKPPTCG